MKRLDEFSLIEQFRITRWFYSIGQPIITDAQYTTLLRAVEEIYPDSDYVKQSWSSDTCPVNLLKEMGREDAITAVISSDKTESIQSLNTWSEVSQALSNWTGKGTISYKHDGWNIQAHYYNGELLRINTRGRSSDFMNVDILRTQIPNKINLMGQIRIVMECTISNSNWKIVRQKYGGVSQRSSVSTLLAHPEDVNLVTLHALDIHGTQTDDKFLLLKFLGFNVPEYVTVQTYGDIEDAVYELADSLEEYDYPTDGLVFDGGYKYALRVEVWEEKLYKSYITGYEESYNRYVISPRLQIRPIYREGAIQKYIPITNWQRIIDLNLCKGSPVAFSLVSGAIADIDEYATRLLQKEYEGNYGRYMAEIDVINSEQVNN